MNVTRVEFLFVAVVLILNVLYTVRILSTVYVLRSMCTKVSVLIACAAAPYQTQDLVRFVQQVQYVHFKSNYKYCKTRYILIKIL